MMMADLIHMLPMFLIEGTAEYARIIPIENAVFDCDEAKRANGIKKANDWYFNNLENLKGFQGIQDFEVLLQMGQAEWAKKMMLEGQVGAGKKEVQLMQASLYHSSLLLTHYFMDLDKEGYLDLGDKGNVKGVGLLELLHYSQEDMKFLRGKGRMPAPFGFEVEKFKKGHKSGKPFLHRIDLLLKGRTPKEVADDAWAKLKAAQFRLE